MVAGGRELIDTLWNVNDVCKPHTPDKSFELIDTLWNVNTVVTVATDLFFLN